MTDHEERFDDLPVLSSLGEQLAAAAVAIDAPARPARRWWRRRRVVGILLAGLLPAAAATAAATGVFSPGSPVPRSTYEGTDGPLSRLEPGSARLVAVRVADPDGGPMWGIRVFRVRSGVSCVQVARVVGGRVGVLGLAGAFGDDRRFHALPAQPALALTCGWRDRAGHLFLDGMGGPVAASADPRTASQRGLPASERRQVIWGFAGPLATSVRITVRGHTRQQAVRSEDDGAYLFVLRGPRAAVRRTTTYRDERRCSSGPGLRTPLRCIPPPGYR